MQKLFFMLAILNLLLKIACFQLGDRLADVDKYEKTGVYLMSRVCHFTGKRTIAGQSISRRGKAKYLGGVGRKVTGITKRKFKPNIQKVRAIIDGKVCRIRVSAKAIRMGLVQKPPKRNYNPDQTSAQA